MSKQIFVNLPVSNVSASTEFYTKLGFTLNPTFSNENASCMVWSDNIYVMLLVHEFYSSFIATKTIADTKQTSAALLCLSLESKDAVDNFAHVAKDNGGDFYQVESEVPADMMFGLEVQDPDGHMWEPMWMNPDFEPHTTE